MRQWKHGKIKAVVGRADGDGSGAGVQPKGAGSARAKMFGKHEAEKARKFHQSFPEYVPTPLISLDSLAELLGVGGIYVKDESYRFGLNAFKGLGGSYCIGNYVAKKLGMDISELTYEYLTGAEVKEKLGKITFITATDGNHGRGIAWTANRLGQGCVVLMPKGSAAERLENIRALGAEAWIPDVNYDDTVRMAKDMADKNGWVLVQDTAWDGYEEIPGWIMQGYTTMGCEIVEQLKELGKRTGAGVSTQTNASSPIRPTHIFLQAGVGAMAGAMTGFFADYYDGEMRSGGAPTIVIVEPDKADCIYKTAAANDGKLHAVTGDLDSIMAGLCCGEACTIGWDVLKNRADAFISMPDEIAARGMRILGNPAGTDLRVISGESGAASLGFAAAILMDSTLAELKDLLRINEESRILCISTEGATDSAGYQKIVWDGLYSVNNL